MNKPAKKTEAVANDAQRAAADPAASVWVSANAGSGKTHVLVDRVARLLLTGPPGVSPSGTGSGSTESGGTDPGRILCLTFTKAAAAEMASRLYARLGSWATMDDAALAETLTRLEGAAPDWKKLELARRLFARALETPGGLKIQTIHAFCERLLGLFPLEAEVPPHFEILDERTAAELMGEARDDVLDEADGAGGDTPTANALARARDFVSSRVDEQGFDQLFWEIAANRGRFSDLFRAHGGVEKVAAEIWQAVGLDVGDTPEAIAAAACAADALPEPMLRRAADILATGSKTDKERAARIADFLSSQDRAGGFAFYADLFLTRKDEPLKRLMTKGLADAHPDLLAALAAEQARVVAVTGRRKAALVAQASEAVLVLAAALIGAFERIKTRRALLDYDDLIVKSRDLLLRSRMAAWVLYKLDGGLDHILVDEAQDTSPDQWRVVQRLAEEFLSGEGVETGTVRTIFAVGDEKQSIYSFQGADPAHFDTMRRYFGARVREARLRWAPVPLVLSFRSVREVLGAVDTVFERDDARAGLSAAGEAVVHEPFRQGDAGLVEIWDTEKPADMPDDDPWHAPLDNVGVADPRARLALRIANTIERWIGSGEILTAKGRPIRPGDIIILVRRRDAFVEEVIRALKNKKIAVAGTDRMVLTEQIAVMDLIALGEFAILPEDDLTLATVLKSPLIGLSEDDLFDLAYGRSGNLWAALGRRAGERPSFAQAYAFLSGVLARADYAPPYEFYAELLSRDGARKKLMARLGVDASDPIDEFLALALEFERAHPPSLQAFLHWIAAGETQIKRDLDHGRDEVRVMTVHGAKGLEAEIVFLPDTCTVPGGRHDPRLLATGDEPPLILWPGRRLLDDEVSAAARTRARAARMDEYRRLLYVAMTRARDRLYVCGYEDARGRQDGCWYDLIAEALKPRAAEVTLESGEPVWRIEGEQTGMLTGREEKAPPALPTVLEPWAREAPAPEPVPPRPLAPSRLALAEDGAALPEPPPVSPLAGDRTDRYRRGRLIHRLLQTLPDLPGPGREEAARRFLAAGAHGLDGAAQDEIRAAAFAVLESPEFAPIFGSGSRAEVPIVGRLATRGEGAGKAMIAGQIDRLLVTPDHVLVIDYKTNRPPPRQVSEVSPAYLAQMAAYVRILEEIYPNRPVRAALLWTDGPSLMILPPDRLEKALGTGGDRGALDASEGRS